MGASLGNGITGGIAAAVSLTLFLEVTGRRRHRLEAPLSPEALPRIDAFLGELASAIGWNEP